MQIDNCPFFNCGAPCTVARILKAKDGMFFRVHCTNCSYSANEWDPEETAIAIHNDFCRKVREYESINITGEKNRANSSQRNDVVTKATEIKNIHVEKPCEKVDAYFMQVFDNGIVMLAINSQERWPDFHRYNYTNFEINGVEFEIPELEGILDSDNTSYFETEQICKNQIICLFTPFELVGHDSISKIRAKKEVK